MLMETTYSRATIFMINCTVLQTKRVHFAFWHKLAYNFKITSSVFKKS